MKNKAARNYLGIVGIGFIVFQCLCFLTPNELGNYYKFGGSFWAGYVFTNLSFLLFFFCLYKTINESNKTNQFYDLSLLRVSRNYLIMMIIVGVVVMLVPDLALWIGITITGILFVFSAIKLLKTDTAIEVVEHIDNKAKEKTSNILSWRSDSSNLINLTNNAKSRNSAKKIADAFKFSDPVSNESLLSIEQEINDKFNEYKEHINDEEIITNLEQELISLIKERNEKCKLGK